MSPLEVHDPGLHDLVAPDAPIERIAGGLTFTEGPVWRRGSLLFSDIPNDRIVRLRYRNSRERGEPVTPGAPMQVRITLYPTSNLFMPGHRIRLDLSSSNHPRFDVNPNTGDLLAQERRSRVAENTVYHDPRRPSRILLPVVAR